MEKSPKRHWDGDINPGDSLMVLGDKKQGIAIPPKNMFSQIMRTIFGGAMPESVMKYERYNNHESDEIFRRSRSSVRTCRRNSKRQSEQLQS